MTEVLVYGVLEASARIRAHGVRLVEHGDVAAVVGDVDGGPVAASRAVREHWRVLEEVGATTTVLPVRFGTAMGDDRAVVDGLLAPGHDRLKALLAELEGKVQLTVKGRYDEQALMRGVVDGSPAVARLRTRVAGLPEAAAYYERIELGRLVAAEVERAREQDTQRVLERLERLAIATSPEPASSLDSAIDAAFLVARERVDEFAAAVADLGRELEQRMRLRCVGPLPPYSFAGERVGSPAWA